MTIDPADPGVENVPVELIKRGWEEKVNIYHAVISGISRELQDHTNRLRDNASVYRMEISTDKSKVM